MNKKITRATLKKFVKENRSRLYIRVDYEFDGMIDGTRIYEDAIFEPVQNAANSLPDDRYTLGIAGLYIHENSGFRSFREGEFTGIMINSVCSSTILAIREAEAQREVLATVAAQTCRAKASYRPNRAM